MLAGARPVVTPFNRSTGGVVFHFLVLVAAEPSFQAQTARVLDGGR